MHGLDQHKLNVQIEPLVWPSPLKFISKLNPESKLLLYQSATDNGNNISEVKNMKRLKDVYYIIGLSQGNLIG
ncbi:hypothetical protein MKW98_029128 [Papaver atlanticum]|uniref:Uncharacterized protein n=1 Tax=Papaver atlanticum TaxID=357466 RepID=A0AAD4S978_9MAGN|nr:hypothetical protein MKW98_029128 [Papaver atlanticum]